MGMLYFFVPIYVPNNPHKSTNHTISQATADPAYSPCGALLAAASGFARCSAAQFEALYKGQAAAHCGKHAAAATGADPTTGTGPVPAPAPAPAPAPPPAQPCVACSSCTVGSFYNFCIDAAAARLLMLLKLPHVHSFLFEIAASCINI